LRDLLSPPGNRLERLKGARGEEYSIRINDRWRIVFRLRKGMPRTCKWRITIHEIQTFKNEMIFVRRVVWPLREVVSGLGRRESPLIKETTEIYLRDVYDHIVQVMDTIEVYREMLSGMLDIYLSSVSNRLNSVMKVLTIIATIFMPLTFIAGIYGMNFKYMPELEWRFGYPLLLIGMALIAIFMLITFKRKKWL
jgi:magnesium transporter